MIIYHFRFSALLALFLTATLLFSQSSAQEPPNIIFVLTDDQRFDAIGYAGNPLAHTPEMDDLARSGTFFSRAMVSTPICAASRATILTGLYERAHRFNFQTGDVRETYMQNAYPVLLKDAGYYTGFYGKFGVRYAAADKLFDEYDGYDRNNAYQDRRGYFYKTIDGDTVHLTRYTGQQAVDFIDSKADGGKPFCLSLSFSAPHAHDSAEDQYFWQAGQDNWLADQRVPPAALDGDEFFNALPAPVRDGFNRLRWTWRYDTPAKYQHSVKGYYRMIAGVDKEIGKIRAKLEEKGVADNTVIILMGDNGYFLGERQLAGKWLMYDNSVRVPLIVYDPRSPATEDSEAMALNVDVPATILDLAGVPAPPTYQGKSLLPLVKGKSTNLRDTALIEHLWNFENIPPSEGLRTDEWKYLRYVNNLATEELYNLKNDPAETQNLINDPDHSAILTAMRIKMDELGATFSDGFAGVPTDLSIEYIRRPDRVVLLDDTPEFSWVVPAANGVQTGYQILVASSEEQLAANQGDVWDSGEVRSGQSINVPYAGASLQGGKSYHWKVRIWDAVNRLTAYSASQSFYGPQTDPDHISTANFFLREEITPKSFVTTDYGYFADFGKDAFANLAFTFTAKRPEVLTLRVGELLKDGRIDPEPGGNIRFAELEIPVKKGTHTYHLPFVPDERNTKSVAVQMPDSFPTLLPFRYLEIDRPRRGKVEADNLRQLAFFGYWEEDESYFTSSDTILNQIWDLCKYSIKATSFAGLYVDGDRERIPYEADAYLNQLSHYTTDREFAIARRTIEYFMEHPTWPTEWQLHVALMFHADYMYTGDTELVETYYDELKYKTLAELVGPDGMVSSSRVTPEFMTKLGFSDPSTKLRDIVDWPPAKGKTGWDLARDEGEQDGFVFMPNNTVINALYYRNMVIMAEFAELLGKTEDQLEFEVLAARAKQAVNDKMLDKQLGRYVDGEGTDHASVHANMFPLAFGMVPAPYEKSVAAFIETRGMACSVYGAQYLMEALYRAGYDQYGLDLMRSTEERSWYNMIRVGSTVSMEAWDLKHKPNLDLNHAWGAVPGNAIPRLLWGIQPQTPGFGKAEIKPQFGDLSSTEILVPTLRGGIRGKYEVVNQRLRRIEISLPGNMVAELIPPVKEGEVVYLNGKAVNPAFPGVRIEPGISVIELRVNSF